MNGVISVKSMVGRNKVRTKEKQNMKRNIAIALLTVAMACAIVIGSSVTPPEVVVTASPGTELVDDQMDHAAAAPVETTPVETVPKETISSETEVETTAPVHYCDWGDNIY